MKHVSVHFPHRIPGFIGGQQRPWWTAGRTPYGERVVGCSRTHGVVVMLHQQWCNYLLPWMMAPHPCLVFPDMKAFVTTHPLVAHWSEAAPTYSGHRFPLRMCSGGGAQSFHQETMRTTDSVCLLALDKTVLNATSEMYWNVILFRNISQNTLPVIA